VRIRPAEKADWAAVRELCCLTGKSGAPVARSRWPFFAEYWIGPYEKLLPGWAYVADVGGVVRGYLTGCPDSRAFSRVKGLLFTAPLLARALRGDYGFGEDVRRFARRTLRLERSPERVFSRSVRRRVAREFPAHLHVNVDGTYRAGGLGRALIERFCADLGARGVPGVHVFCGAGPVRFYERLGFVELGAIDFRVGRRSPPARVFCLGRSL
jgi:hypothetical protein